jgi:butyrate kinase
VDAVILTGGLARCDYLIASLKKKISFLGEVLVFPGENEMRALALGALRVLSGEETARDYSEAIRHDEAQELIEE